MLLILIMVFEQIKANCYFIKLNPRKKGTFIFCLPALLGIHRNSKQKDFFRFTERFNPIYLIYPLKKAHGGSLGHFWEKITKWHFHSASKEDIWPKKFSNSMQGLRSAILAIFQTGSGWPGTVSAALKNPSQDFKNSFCIGCR